MAEEADLVEEEVEDATAEADDGDAADDVQTKPGTPDKALQKMQQELGNATREIAALKGKLDTQGSLSEADRKKIERAEQRIERIREFAPDDPIAEHVLELTERLGKADLLEKKLAEADDRLKRLENKRAWSEVREKYRGLDVEAIWGKAQDDARETLGDTANDDAILRLASRWFEERCDGAKKRLKDPPKSGSKKDGSYRVGDSLSAAPTLSEEEDILREARSLIVEID